MYSSFMPLQTALSGLEVAQEQIDTTGENIDNANNPAYTRQRVNVTDRVPLLIPAYSSVTGGGVQLGTGVDATSITRVRDQFLDTAYRNQSSASGNATTEASVLQQLQSALGEPANGISTQLSAFWSSWANLANNPQSGAARQTVINAGTNLAGAFNTLSQQLSALQTQTQQQFAALTGPSGQVQNDANSIAQLNTAIAAAQAGGQNPNNLLDQRDQALDDLSTLANIQVTNNSNGTVSVNFGDASSPLVNGSTVNWPQTITSAAGGQLGALLNLGGAGGQIASYSSQLDAVASQLIANVNAVSGTQPIFSGSSAGTIALAVTSATVPTTTTGNPGANDVALAVAALSGGQADQSYAAFVANVGGGVQAANSNQSTQQALAAAIQSQRQSSDGVSMDEEMTNLVLFQRAYQASARVMTTVDSMLDTLVNHTGTVGL